MDAKRSDTIVASNGSSYLVANTTEILNGMTPLDMNTQRIKRLSPGTLVDDAINKKQLDDGLLLKKNITSTDAKIQNSADKTSINCASDRYIDIRSNGNKIVSILEDEVNLGCTLLTEKRFNVVAQ